MQQLDISTQNIKKSNAAAQAIILQARVKTLKHSTVRAKATHEYRMQQNHA